MTHPERNEAAHAAPAGLRRCCAALIAAVACTMPTLAHAIAVEAVTPAKNAINVARATTITIRFDRALAPASVTRPSLRVFGAQRGPMSGTLAYSDGDRTLTFTPAQSFFPGETVSVQLAHTITGVDATPLRQAGYAFQFVTAAGAASMAFTQIDEVSVRTDGSPTRLYGGAYADLDRDGWVDYVAVNELSFDLRVLLNRADGSGLLGPVLTPTIPIGHESSPNEIGDFDNDGNIDFAVSNTSSDSVSIVLGLGNGRFAPQQEVAVGATPHGIAALDVDGDADLDLVVATEDGNVLSLLRNDGHGVFGQRSDFNSGGNGEYALAPGDMNGDGILDLVVGTRYDNNVIVLTGNGDGSFSPAANIDGGGLVWKLVLGDVNGDGALDVASVNGQSGNGAIILGNGDGSLQPPTIYTFGAQMVASDLGDLDGDGDLDWVASNYGAGRWHVLKNDGHGAFTEDSQIDAPSAGSCASLYDFDNDGDLDMALADENADVVLLMRNGDRSDTIFRNGFETEAADAGRAIRARARMKDDKPPRGNPS